MLTWPYRILRFGIYGYVVRRSSVGKMFFIIWFTFVVLWTRRNWLLVWWSPCRDMSRSRTSPKMNRNDMMPFWYNWKLEYVANSFNLVSFQNLSTVKVIIRRLSLQRHNKCIRFKTILFVTNFYGRRGTSVAALWNAFCLI